ncbi:MAG: squalene/phytoene synthase family protein, partial [Dolichospermum sp.]
LQNISLTLQAGVDGFSLDAFSIGFKGYENSLQEVSLRIREWSILAPESIAPRIWDATAAMADRMVYWADKNWQIETEADLDRYTFGVAGAVGLLLSDLWNWYDGTQSNRTQAIGFGRGLQAVNILRNNAEDLTRGVNFFPVGWNNDNLQEYARRNLILADAYTKSLPIGPALQFCQIPLALAHGTLDALANGKEKLSRSDVVSLIEKLMSVNAKAS